MRWDCSASKERGSVTILGLGVFLVVAALIAIGIDVTAVHLRRMELWNLADGAALDAAAALHEGGYYDGEAAEPHGGLVLADEAVRRAAADYLREAPRAGELDVRLLSAQVVDQRSAQVRLVARYGPPISGPLLAALGGGIGIEASARARAQAPSGAQPAPVTTDGTANDGRVIDDALVEASNGQPGFPGQVAGWDRDQ